MHGFDISCCMARRLWLDDASLYFTCAGLDEWLLNVVGPALCHMSNRVLRLGDESEDLVLSRHADSNELPATSPSSNENALADDASRG